MKRVIRNLGLAAVLVAAAAINAPQAHATPFTLDFALTSGSPDATGSFTYDTTTNTLQSFVVSWAGGTFDFTSQFKSDTLAQLTTPGNWAADTTTISTVPPSTQADFFFNGPSPAPTGHIIAFSFPAAAGLIAQGSYTVEATSAVPEPSTIALLATGLLGLGLIRRRKRA
jgi:hypothetical protein